jgi:hypothetical protein
LILDNDPRSQGTGGKLVHRDSLTNNRFIYTMYYIHYIHCGLIYNASGCAITAIGFQTLPDLQSDFHVTPDVPHLYVPEKVTVVADHERQLLEEAITPSDAM